MMWSLSKLKFTCPKCSEEFFVQMEYFKDKQSVKCCCCETQFPDELIAEIKTAISHLSNAYKTAMNDEKEIFEFDLVPIPIDQQYIHHIRQK